MPHGLTSAPPTRCSRPRRRLPRRRARPTRSRSSRTSASFPARRRIIAEHMAAALFAGHQRFARDADGRWPLREASASRDVAARVRRGARVTALASSSSIVVVDVETTGSRAYRGDRITEIAAVLVRDGVVDDRLRDARESGAADSAGDHGAHEHHVRRWCSHAPTFAEVCDQLLGVLEGHVFVAHNANFDWRFLSTEVERATRTSARSGDALCTVRLARRLVPQSAAPQPRRDRRTTTASRITRGIAPAATRSRRRGRSSRMLDAARDRGCAHARRCSSVCSRARTAAPPATRRRRTALDADTQSTRRLRTA